MEFGASKGGAGGTGSRFRIRFPGVRSGMEVAVLLEGRRRGDGVVAVGGSMKGGGVVQRG